MANSLFIPKDVYLRIYSCWYCYKCDQTELYFDGFAELKFEYDRRESVALPTKNKPLLKFILYSKNTRNRISIGWRHNHQPNVCNVCYTLVYHHTFYHTIGVPIETLDIRRSGTSLCRNIRPRLDRCQATHYWRYLTHWRLGDLNVIQKCNLQSWFTDWYL